MITVTSTSIIENLFAVITKHHHPTYIGLSLSDTETSDYGQWVLLYCMSMAKGTQLECWLASCMHCRLHRLVCTLVQYCRWMVLQETGGLQSHLLMVPDGNSIVCWLTWLVPFCTRFLFWLLPVTVCKVLRLHCSGVTSPQCVFKKLRTAFYHLLSDLSLHLWQKSITFEVAFFQGWRCVCVCVCLLWG